MSLLATFSPAWYFCFAVTGSMSIQKAIETKLFAFNLTDLLAIGFILYLITVCYFVILLTNSAQDSGHHLSSDKFIFTLTIFFRIFIHWKCSIYVYVYVYVYAYIWSVSEDSRIVTSLRGFLVRVCYVVLNQGCCETCQYNLLDRMLWHDFNTTLNQSYVNSHYFG